MTDDQNEQFEYNDGLGDLLREKERREFSWLKTSIVLITFIFVIFFCLTFLFNMSKSIFMGKNSKTGTEHRVQDLDRAGFDERSFEEQISQIEKENMSLIGDIEDFLEEDKKQGSKLTAQQKEAARQDKSRVKTAANRYPYKIIVGSFTAKSNATERVAQLKATGMASFTYMVTIKGTRYYRVQAGAFATRAEGKAFVNELKRKSIDSYIIKKN